MHGSDFSLAIPVVEIEQRITFNLQYSPTILKKPVITYTKKWVRPVVNIVRDIILDSDRFYNPVRRHRRLSTSTGTKINYPKYLKQIDSSNTNNSQTLNRPKSFLWDSNWSQKNSLRSSINSLSPKSAYTDCDSVFEEKISTPSPRSKICEYENPMFQKMN